MPNMRSSPSTAVAAGGVLLSQLLAPPDIVVGAARAAEGTLTGGPPVVIAHRGASSERPEHTLAAYELAIDRGADFIEPDLVATSDGVLVARHENEISGTTDVADHPEFADCRVTKIIDGSAVTGWFAEDFTLAELKTLRAKERLPDLRPGNAAYDGRFEVPTLQEIIDLARRKSEETGRTIGIYPETKHPTYFASIGLPLEGALVAVLAANGYSGPDAPIFIQSFEVGNLKELNRMTEVRLVQLFGDRAEQPYDVAAAGGAMTYGDMASPDGLAEIAAYADGIGPSKDLVVPRDRTGRLREPTSLVADAHAAGLLVHPWTFRSEDRFLPADLRGDPRAEYRLFYALGVDGVFSDYPGLAAEVRAEMFGR